MQKSAYLNALAASRSVSREREIHYVDGPNRNESMPDEIALASEDLFCLVGDAPEISTTARPRETVDLCATPEARFGPKEEEVALSKEIGRLPSSMRSVLLARDLDKMSMLEASESLGISTVAVKSRLLRARRE